jgi:hypothetical protein
MMTKSEIEGELGLPEMMDIAEGLRLLRNRYREASFLVEAHRVEHLAERFANAAAVYIEADEIPF